MALEKQTCIWCRQEITSYNRDPRKAAYEKKWSIHWECMWDKVADILDRTTIAGAELTAYDAVRREVRHQ